MVKACNVRKGSKQAASEPEPRKPCENSAVRIRVSERHSVSLLALLSVQGNLAKSWRILLELQLLGTRFSQQNVVNIAGFLANQVGRFFLFLALGHGFSRLTPNIWRKGMKVAYYANGLPGWLAQLGKIRLLSGFRNPMAEKTSKGLWA